MISRNGHLTWLRLALVSFFCSSCLWAASRADPQSSPPHGAAVNFNRLILTGQNGRHTYRIYLAQRPFRKSTHRISHSHHTDREEDDVNLLPLVDGKEPLGTDGGLPDTELSAFLVFVDGKEWPVPSRLWRDCYEPMLNEKYLTMRLSRDGVRLTIGMSASDGAGAYYVKWYLRRYGDDTRDILDPDDYAHQLQH